MTGPRYIQLVRNDIDGTVGGLSFDARSVLVDVLMRVDYRTLVFVTTLTDYAAFLGIPRRRLSSAVTELEGAGAVVTSFPRGHEGTVEVPVDIYDVCVRSRAARAPYARHTRATRADTRVPRADMRERAGDTSTDLKKSEVRSQKSDPVYRFRDIRDVWSASSGKGVTDDDLARCLTLCRTDCVDVGADYTRIIDETLGRVLEQVQKGPHGVQDLCGYVRRSVRQNARERLGMPV